MDCIFCKIINKEITTDIVYENDNIIGFNDMAAQAPIHVLFIPKIHISTINDISEQQALIAGQLVLAAKQYANQIAVAEKGYRIVMNCNQDGGQSVYHIHLHFLAGRQMKWPPG